MTLLTACSYLRGRSGRAGRPIPGAPAVLALAALGLLVLLAACTPLEERPTEALPDHLRLEPPLNAQVSLVYGYLDMSDAPTGLEWMEFRQVSPPTDTPYYQMRVHEGVFYMEKFPPGVFVMGEFGGQRWNGQHLAYQFPRSSPAVRVVIDRPGLHYVGAFRYRPVAENGVRLGRFEIDRLPAPTDDEVLVRILPFARGTAWEPRIRAELSDGK